MRSMRIKVFKIPNMVMAGFFFLLFARDALKKNYVDRETVPKVGRGVGPFPYKNHY